MNEPDPTPTHEAAAGEPAEASGLPAATTPEPRRQGAGGALGILALVIAVVAIGAFLWLWQQQQGLADKVASLPQPQPTVDPSQIATLQDRVQALEKQVTAEKAAPATPPPDLKPLEARIAALEARKPPPPPPAPDLSPLRQQIDTLAAEAGAAKSDAAKQADQIAALHQQLQGATAALQGTEQQAKQSEDRAARAQTLARAQVALDNGQPLGPIPGAPPALARFATTPPPTEAGLRLSFPQAAAEAKSASAPSNDGLSFGQRVLRNAESLVSVKQGDHVLVGSPAEQVLGDAQTRLDAGDLAGAVHELGRLDPAATKAMADWRSQAQALLDARAALAQMARA